MKNVYDIRFEKNLVYIFPVDSLRTTGITQNMIHEKAAVILYLFYIDTLPNYYGYIDGIPDSIDVYIISSKAEVLETVQSCMEQLRRGHIRYILKENTGRDVSALLVAASEIVKKYQYICFVHDKKAHDIKLKDATSLWIENLWENLLGSESYIDNILRRFEENDRLGILAPPDPIGDHFAAWYGFGWYGSFSITKKIAEELELRADLTENRPPITLGTALWFRKEALSKLFDRRWTYDDFNDEGLMSEKYLSYGIERIFAYVAQDAGYDTGTVMTSSYAERQTNYLQYSTSKIFSEIRHFFPFYTVDMIEEYRKSTRKMIEFARKNPCFYLYGAGTLGRFCHYVLREENLLPAGYLVSEEAKREISEGVPVFSIEKVRVGSDMGVIVTVFEKSAREEIKRILKKKKIVNYIEFWEE
ncbi:rhamnan synthesis F family protein [Lachnospiraceae bacterium 56-18]|uniref:rhamnan synthesis F family protein n=1 Tax=Sporofaciens sp. JLR.KK001 TaxID=3112621 RepID=UPI002FF30378